VEWIGEPQEFLKAEDNEECVVSKKKKKNKIVDAVLWDEKVCIFVNFVPRETTLNFSCYVAGLGVRRYSTLVASRLVG